MRIKMLAVNLAILLAGACSRQPCFAQAAPVVGQAAQAVAGVITPDDWVKIGKTFGPDASWQFGFDRSNTVTACYEYDVTDSENLVGYCRTLFILARHGARALMLGGGVLYDVDDLARARAAYRARLAVNVRPAAAASLRAISEKIPYLEELGDFAAPKPLQYIGDATTLFVSGGPRLHPLPTEHAWGWGVGADVTIPLPDLTALFGK